MKLIYPVIHHLNLATTQDQTNLAIQAGANGVFLIDHAGRNNALALVLPRLCPLPEDFKLGVNFLGLQNTNAYDLALDSGADMIWFDSPGIRDGKLVQEGQRLQEHAARRGATLEVFASVAFKHQPEDEDAAGSVEAALDVEWVPVTSGPATGSAPSIAKMKDMSCGGKLTLGVASGMAVDNVSWYVPWVTHFLVATGVSQDFHHFDYELLAAFIGTVRRAEAC